MTCLYNSRIQLSEQEIPSDLTSAVESAGEAVVEGAAEGDDELLMKYLDRALSMKK